MSDETRMKMAAKAVHDLIDCLEGVVSEQGYEGIERYTHDPARMLAEAKSAKEYLREYATGGGEPSEKTGTPGDGTQGDGPSERRGTDPLKPLSALRFEGSVPRFAASI